MHTNVNKGKALSMERFSQSLSKNLTLLSVSFLCLSASANAEEPIDVNIMNTVPVSVISTHFKEVSKPVVTSGLVRPVSEQSLTFKVGGIIERVWVKEGQEVKKGQILASLIMDEIDATVEKEQAVYKDAQQQLARISDLKSRQLTAEQLRQQAKTAVDIAHSDLKIALFNKKYSVITAPEDGLILTRSIEPHELVSSGQDAFVFADRKQGWSVKLAVADIDVVKLALNNTASIRLDAYPKQIFQGKVVEISGRADSHSQTFEVDVILAPTNSQSAFQFYSGLIAHTEITSSHTQQLAEIPFSALIKANGSTGTAYVVNPQGQAILKTVTIAYLSGNTVMVKGGLEEGEQVIMQGGQFIAKGSNIRIINPVNIDDPSLITQSDIE